jgi:hypothetical protein
MKSFWFGRFTVNEREGNLVFKDNLSSGHREISSLDFEQYSGDQLILEYFLRGFLSSTLNLSPFNIQDSAPDNHSLFWQFPCITEKKALALHIEIDLPKVIHNQLHIYLGLPWATFVDKNNFPNDLIRAVKVKISGIHHVLKEIGFELKVHTVCQHVYWDRCLDVWEDLGLTDIWLAHFPSNLSKYKSKKLTFHPWALYAVNVEDPERRYGLTIGKPIEDKKYLASFIGAYATHYLTTDRIELLQLSNESGFYIELFDRWHFEDVVYGHQVKGESIDHSYVVDQKVHKYNQVLSDSIFSLCPSGAGPNSLRLWESLAVGSIPIIIGNHPILPEGGSLSPIEWESIVVKIEKKDILKLPQILRSMTMDDIKLRQSRALVAYEGVMNQRCF